MSIISGYNDPSYESQCNAPCRGTIIDGTTLVVVAPDLRRTAGYRTLSTL
jgi:hypothetical protein